jgi:UDP-GlcNAc3NAcA epimerase
MKILTVIGARPQFVKAAEVSRAMQKRANLTEVLVHTGQHYDNNMSGVFFSELELPPPAYHLGVGSGSHGKQTGQMLEHIERVLVQESPDCVLVYGDTNSTLAGALAAAKLHIPVAHVEAGLRSFNRRMPEEINRVLTDHVSDLLFAPTSVAVKNLAREGIQNDKVILCGDVMYDVALYYARKVSARTNVLSAYGLEPKGYTLATVHRAENTDDRSRLQEIVAALCALADRMPVVLPLHPRTRAAMKRLDIEAKPLRMIDPVGYLEMAALESGAALIATDSGGVQKEAFFHRVPCVTLRDETEWRELIEGGYNQLAGADRRQILDCVDVALASRPNWDRKMYGDGDACTKIIDALQRFTVGGVAHGS